MTDFEDINTAGKKKKTKKKSSKKKTPAAETLGAPSDDKKKKPVEKPKTALSMPDEDEEEIDLVARMEEARRAMPNACVVSNSSCRCMSMLDITLHTLMCKGYVHTSTFYGMCCLGLH